MPRSPRLASTAVILLLLAAAAAAEDRTGDQAPPPGPNPYNPIPQGPGSAPFGIGSPAGTQFSRDPQTGGGAQPTDRNGAQTTTEPGSGARNEEQATPPTSADAAKAATGQPQPAPAAPASPPQTAQPPAEKPRRNAKKRRGKVRPANRPQTRADERDSRDPELPAADPSLRKDLIKDDAPGAATPNEEVEPDDRLPPR